MYGQVLISFLQVVIMRSRVMCDFRRLNGVYLIHHLGVLYWVRAEQGVCLLVSVWYRTNKKTGYCSIYSQGFFSNPGHW
ncbi:hypothetical protein BX600DRAFT_25133 [Xylariales sp. PMI_506]|nr:hypothetical protein BX600DRAFT_25133 [Xylariales sp. PMI_506]